GQRVRDVAGVARGGGGDDREAGAARGHGVVVVGCAGVDVLSARRGEPLSAAGGRVWPDRFREAAGAAGEPGAAHGGVAAGSVEAVRVSGGGHVAGGEDRGFAAAGAAAPAPGRGRAAGGAAIRPD